MDHCQLQHFSIHQKSYTIVYLFLAGFMCWPLTFPPARTQTWCGRGCARSCWRMSLEFWLESAHWAASEGCQHVREVEIAWGYKKVSNGLRLCPIFFSHNVSVISSSRSDRGPGWWGTWCWRTKRPGLSSPINCCCSNTRMRWDCELTLNWAVIHSVLCVDSIYHCWNWISLCYSWSV
jgi:hypothetical protein